MLLPFGSKELSRLKGEKSFNDASSLSAVCGGFDAGGGRFLFVVVERVCLDEHVLADSFTSDLAFNEEGIISLLCRSRVVRCVISGVFEIAGDSPGGVSSEFANSAR